MSTKEPLLLLFVICSRTDWCFELTDPDPVRVLILAERIREHAAAITPVSRSWVIFLQTNKVMAFRLIS